MAYLINEYHTSQSEHKKERVLNDLFVNYVDKIISGIIFSGQYNFWKYAELDDLIQEGRMAILISVQKKQWDPERGTIFNFFSTVVSRNLTNFTNKQNKNHDKKSDIEIDKIFNNPFFTYRHNYNRNFIMEDFFGVLERNFRGKKKFEHLTELLKHFYHNNMNKKFVKKRFIEFAAAYNYSPTLVNTFFSHIQRLTYLDKEAKHLIEPLTQEEHYE